ncbi:MAG: hypothetical protein ACK4UL_11350 [Novosphingobium meiothermophilum]|uniref:hypothetical protein n=1 Tax=Novosphingobium TaxID=165696 RepID=UPI0011AB3B1B|nr:MULTISPECIES: hypothetical protein [Novosphingobium]
MTNPEVTFPSRIAPVTALAYAKQDGSAEVVSLDKPLPVSGGTMAYALPGGAAQTVSEASPLPVRTAPLPAGNAHIGNVFLDDVGDGLTVAGSVTSADVVVSAPLTGFAGGTFQVVSGGNSCTVNYEHSNDGINWIAIPVIATNGATSSPSITTTAVGLYAFSSNAGFVRARVSSYGSGTVSIVLVLKRRPLNVTSTSLAGSGASIGNVVVTGTVNTSLGYTDSTTALAASASFTGTGRVGNSTPFCFFIATAFADVAGTLFIEHSLDGGTTYHPIQRADVPAGEGRQLVARMTGTYGTNTLYRVRYVNGLAAQGTFRLSSAFSAR